MTITRDHGDLRGHLGNRVTTAWSTNQRLAVEATLPAGRGADITGIRTAIIHAAPPWNNGVALLVLDLHQLARDLEADMIARLRVRTTRPGQRAIAIAARGGSNENTRLALRHVVTLSYHATDDEVRDAALRLDGWIKRAGVMLDEAAAARRLPRDVGSEETRCPWCRYLTLRWWESRAIIACVNPSCVDGQGNRPIADIVVDPTTLAPGITWRAPLPVREEMT